MLADINKVTTGGTGYPRYRVYSAHDTNIANWLTQINPTYNYLYIAYAANIFIELYSDSTNYFVKTLYNGKPLILEQCQGQEVCTLDNFTKQMQTQLFQGDL
mgnify:CR=1 FL=1